MKLYCVLDFLGSVCSPCLFGHKCESMEIFFVIKTLSDLSVALLALSFSSFCFFSNHCLLITKYPNTFNERLIFIRAQKQISNWPTLSFHRENRTQKHLSDPRILRKFKQLSRRCWLLLVLLLRNNNIFASKKNRSRTSSSKDISRAKQLNCSILQILNC